MKLENEEYSIYDVEALYRDVLEAFKKGDVLVDVSSVNKMDMSVIQLLISLQKSCKESAKRFELQNVSASLVTILENSASKFLVEQK